MGQGTTDLDTDRETLTGTLNLSETLTLTESLTLTLTGTLTLAGTLTLTKPRALTGTGTPTGKLTTDFMDTDMATLKDNFQKNNSVERVQLNIILENCILSVDVIFKFNLSVLQLR